MTPRTSIARLADDAPIPRPESWVARHPAGIHYIDDTPVMNAAHAAIKAEARATARAAIKMRARAYALRPRDLDAVAYGLFNLRPNDLVRSLKTLFGIQPIRRAGIGGEVPAINLRGAMLYARYYRAKARQLAGRAA
jgi:hypothetical protein